MSTIPLFLIAQQVTLMAVQPQTPNSSGVLSAGTAYSLHDLGIFDRMEFQGSRNLLEISPADAGTENHQPTKRTWTCTIAQIDQAGKVSILTDIYTAFDYLRVAGAAAPPGGTQQKTLVVIGAIADIGTGIVEGRNATILTLRPCGLDYQWQTTPTI